MQIGRAGGQRSERWAPLGAQLGGCQSGDWPRLRRVNCSQGLAPSKPCEEMTVHWTAGVTAAVAAPRIALSNSSEIPARDRYYHPNPPPSSQPPKASRHWRAYTWASARAGGWCNPMAGRDSAYRFRQAVECQFRLVQARRAHGHHGGAPGNAACLDLIRVRNLVKRVSHGLLIDASAPVTTPYINVVMTDG
jgi:hypothetical protein